MTSTYSGNDDKRGSRPWMVIINGVLLDDFNTEVAAVSAANTANGQAKKLGLDQKYEVKPRN